MQRAQALSLVQQNISNQNLIKHMLASGACMRALAARFGQDQQSWELAGLLHDLDYDQTVNDFPRHGKITVEMLGDAGLSGEVLGAIRAHPFKGDLARLRPASDAAPGATEFDPSDPDHAIPRSLMQLSLYSVDPATGLVTAAALMHPSKKLANLDTAFVLKRFKEKRFAAGANREQIQTCALIGLSLEDFIGVCLAAMQGISDDLGL